MIDEHHLAAIRDARLQELAAKNYELDVYLASARKERDELRQHILDIDAHATPYGDIPDEPGFVGTYLLTAGALHRALGKIGHSAPSCQAEAKLAALEPIVAAAKAWRQALTWHTGIHRDNYTTRLADTQDALVAAVDALIARGGVAQDNRQDNPPEHRGAATDDTPASQPNEGADQ